MVCETKELMDAVETRDIGSVRMFVSLGIESTAAMMYAAYGLGSVAIVKLLEQANWSYGDKLHDMSKVAIQSGHDDLVGYVLETHGLPCGHRMLVRYTVKYGTGDSLEHLTACGASTLNDYDYLRELAWHRGDAGILDFLTANTHTKRSYLNHLRYIFNSWFGK